MTSYLYVLLNDIIFCSLRLYHIICALMFKWKGPNVTGGRIIHVTAAGKHYKFLYSSALWIGNVYVFPPLFLP